MPRRTARHRVLPWITASRAAPSAGLRRTRALRALPAAQRATAEVVRGLAVAVRQWRRRLSALALPGETRLRVLGLMGPLVVRAIAHAALANRLARRLPRRRALRRLRRTPAFRALATPERATAEALRGLAVAVRMWRRQTSAQWVRLHPPVPVVELHPHAVVWIAVRAAIAHAALADRLARCRALRRTPALRALPAAERATAEALRSLAVAVLWLAEVHVLPGETRLRVLGLMGPVGAGRRHRVVEDVVSASYFTSVSPTRLYASPDRPILAKSGAQSGGGRASVAARVSALWVRLRPPASAQSLIGGSRRLARRDASAGLGPDGAAMGVALAVGRWRRRISAEWVRRHPPAPIVEMRPHAAWFAAVATLLGSTPVEVLVLMGPVMAFE
ncbi:MAG: hypothetical protein M1826_000934 [Phylliscum demangeonii]|nr:MAG: hypothetical protein M1826_000934 [Phylliscum demangeonii]